MDKIKKKNKPSKTTTELAEKKKSLRSQNHFGVNIKSEVIVRAKAITIAMKIDQGNGVLICSVGLRLLFNQVGRHALNTTPNIQWL